MQVLSRQPSAPISIPRDYFKQHSNLKRFSKSFWTRSDGVFGKIARVIESPRALREIIFGVPVFVFMLYRPLMGSGIQSFMSGDRDIHVVTVRRRSVGFLRRILTCYLTLSVLLLTASSSACTDTSTSSCNCSSQNGSSPSSLAFSSHTSLACRLPTFLRRHCHDRLRSRAHDAEARTGRNRSIRTPCGTLPSSCSLSP